MTERLPFHFSLSCIGEGNGNPLQCSCLESPRDGGAWWAAVCGVTQSRTRLKWLSSSSTEKSNFTWGKLADPLLTKWVKADIIRTRSCWPGASLATQHWRDTVFMCGLTDNLTVMWKLSMIMRKSWVRCCNITDQESSKVLRSSVARKD